MEREDQQALDLQKALSLLSGQPTASFIAETTPAASRNNSEQDLSSSQEHVHYLERST